MWVVHMEIRTVNDEELSPRSIEFISIKLNDSDPTSRKYFICIRNTGRLMFFKEINTLRETWCDYEEYCFLRCDTVQSGRWEACVLHLQGYWCYMDAVLCWNSLNWSKCSGSIGKCHWFNRLKWVTLFHKTFYKPYILKAFHITSHYRFRSIWSSSSV